MTVNEALRWFAEMFEEPEENIAPDTKREDIEGWDSLGILTLMAELDERLDITLSQEELENLSGIDDLLAILRRHDALTE